MSISMRQVKLFFLMNNLIDFFSNMQFNFKI